MEYMSQTISTVYSTDDWPVIKSLGNYTNPIVLNQLSIKVSQSFYAIKCSHVLICIPIWTYINWHLQSIFSITKCSWAINGYHICFLVPLLFREHSGTGSQTYIDRIGVRWANHTFVCCFLLPVHRLVYDLAPRYRSTRTHHVMSPSFAMQ